MATSSGTNNPLSELIKGPLEKISKQISEMVDCAYKIERLEKLAITNPSYETITAQIKRANDFEALIRSIEISELEIERMFQTMQNESKEKQALYDELEKEYEDFFKNLLASSNQIGQLDKDYLEKEYIEKLNNLVSELEKIHDFLIEKIETLEIKIKEVEIQINQLDQKIEQDTKVLMKIIDEMCELGESTPEIEKLIIKVPVLNEKGEAVFKAEPGQETVDLEFIFDKNTDKQELGNIFKDAFKSGKLEKEFVINHLKNHFFNTASKQMEPDVLLLDLTKAQGIDQIFTQRAENTFENITQSPLYSSFIEGYKKIKISEEQKACQINEKQMLIEEKERCAESIKHLDEMRKKLPGKENLNLDALQESLQAAKTLTKEIQTPKSATLTTSANDMQMKTTQVNKEEQKSPTPRTRQRSS